MANYMGKDGFIWWQGVVEDRHDPLYLGRCRVRIIGWHTDDKEDMPTESLPWAYPIQPITSAAQTGVGLSPTGPVEGTFVVGFFRDGEDAQEPVFFGTLGGIPDPPPLANKGFADPRVATSAPDHPFIDKRYRDLNRIDNPDRIRVPRAPVKVSHYAQGSSVNTASNLTGTELLPTGSGVLNDDQTTKYKVVIEEQQIYSRYPDPSYENEPTTPRAARGIYGNFPTTGPLSQYGIVAQKMAWRSELGAGFSVAENSDDTWIEPKPDQIYKARYPYNHVHQSESGHLIEVDDTPGFERLHRYHRSGTFEEIGSLGQRITKVVNEDYTFRLKNDYERVVGNKYQSIQGKLDVISTGGYFHKSGVFKMEAASSASFDTSEFAVNAKSITLNAGSGPIRLKGGSFIKEFKTAENTDTVDGNSTISVGGKMAMRTGSFNVGSRGSAGISAGGGINLIATDNIQESSMNLAGIFGAPARSFKSAIGEVLFETALPGPGGCFTFNGGLSGLLGSISMDSIGNISLNVGPGGSIAKLTLGATGIELSYLSGLSKLSLGPAGCTLDGLTTTVNGSIQAKVTGALTNVEASGINTVKGSLVMIN